MYTIADGVDYVSWCTRKLVCASADGVRCRCRPLWPRGLIWSLSRGLVQCWGLKGLSGSLLGKVLIVLRCPWISPVWWRGLMGAGGIPSGTITPSWTGSTRRIYLVGRHSLIFNFSDWSSQCPFRSLLGGRWSAEHPSLLDTSLRRITLRNTPYLNSAKASREYEAQPWSCSIRRATEALKAGTGSSHYVQSRCMMSFITPSLTTIPATTPSVLGTTPTPAVTTSNPSLVGWISVSAEDNTPICKSIRPKSPTGGS